MKDIILSIKKLVIVLLLGETTLLTNEPVTISSDYSLFEFSESIEALNDGAGLLIDVTSMLPNYNERKLSVVRRDVHKLLGDSVIVANLKNNKAGHAFTYKGGCLVGKNRILIMLSSDEILTEKRWSRMEVKSSVELKNVELLWKNYSI